jgi:hypothetical protein
VRWRSGLTNLWAEEQGSAHALSLVEATPMPNDPDKYREYAADCRRLAEKAKADDKPILIKIAEAWEQQAKIAEASAKNS